MIGTAILTAVTFFIVYQVIRYQVNVQINDNINEEAKKHVGEIEIDRNETYLIQVDQWRAREHNTVSVNPVFVQFLDINDELIDKSPNLKNSLLTLHDSSKDGVLMDTKLNNQPIRQLQVPLQDNNKTIGHLIVAMSLEDATMILERVKDILLFSFPVIMLLVFALARFLAGKNIKPVTAIIKTSNAITKDNLKTRIDLPPNKDELYILSKTINDLLDRIENAVEREKQFTSDASHELRTPLAIIKGTLEVLIRKPRKTEEYNEKISFCISEVDRINTTVDQLLLLARLENQRQSLHLTTFSLNNLISESLSRFDTKIVQKRMSIKENYKDDFLVKSDSYYVSIILNNLISNALKYSNDSGTIELTLLKKDGKTCFSLKDEGIGMSNHDLDKIFDSFYRAHSEQEETTQGTGLGLSIVKRLCDLLAIKIEVSAKKGIGSTFTLIFP